MADGLFRFMNAQYDYPPSYKLPFFIPEIMSTHSFQLRGDFGIRGPSLSSNSSENTHHQKQSRPGGYEANTSPANPAIQQTSVERTSRKVSCTSCRQRKIKCDKENPCSQCTSSFHGRTQFPYQKKTKKHCIGKILILKL